jgi:hypothetical protein
MRRTLSTTSRTAAPRRAGAITTAAALAAAALAAAPAQATIVGLGAAADEPSACFAPKVKTASTICQLFAGTPLRIFATASDEDGMTRLMPQPWTLFSLARGRSPAPVVSWTLFDEDDGDDDPVITPSRSSDYEARFGGNADLAPGTSATLAVQVGVRIAIPTESRSGGARVRVPVTVALGSRGQRGRLELRRCSRPKEFAARSCAGRRGYDVVARRTVRRAGRSGFTIVMPPRTLRRYEVAFRPAARRFATTRQAFQLLRGFDGRTSYRHTVRRAPFGNR